MMFHAIISSGDPTYEPTSSFRRGDADRSTVGFFLYGIGRSMQETVNVTIPGVLSGTVLGVCGPLVFAVLFVIGMRRHGADFGWLRLLAGMLIVGSVAAEVAILHDERRFAREAEGARSIHSRPRAWPNGDASLVFVPGQGIHATD